MYWITVWVQSFLEDSSSLLGRSLCSKTHSTIKVMDMSVPWHVLHRSRYFYCRIRTGTKDDTEKLFSFLHQTFVRFLLPSGKHQPSAHGGASCSLRSLVCLMSHMAIVCLGLLCLWWAAVDADPHSKRQTDVSHMCFHLHLLSISFFTVPLLCFIAQ